MIVFVGGGELKKVFLGNTEIKKIYVGDNLVYPSLVPSIYQKVEYIQYNGGQYIDSLYSPNYYTEIYCKFAHTESSNDTPVFGVRTSYSHNQFVLWSHPIGYSSVGAMLFNGYALESGQAGVYTNLTNLALGTIIEFRYNRSSWKYQNQTGTRSANSGGPGLNLIIGGLRVGSSIDSRKFYGKMYSFKIRDNGTLVRDFVPVYRKSDGVIGLYDIVNNTFYTNSGSGSFTKGPNV